jgi:prefoldin subunit 5
MNTPVLPVAAPTRQQEMEALKDQAQRLTGQLQELNKRIEELGEEPVS